MDKIKKYFDVLKNLIIKYSKKAFDKIKKFCLALKELYDNSEDKKAINLAIISWIITFVIIVSVCRVTADKKDYSNETEIVTEVESIMETSKLLKEDVKTPALKETPAQTSESVSESQAETETTKAAEKETVDVSKLKVSTTPIADDAIGGDNFASINSADVKTLSSTIYESDRLSYGIDVSYHNGNINWSKVKAAGVEYAFIRVGNRGYESGTLCIDSKYREYIRGAQANGIKVGVYFFSQATTEAEALEEASLTLNLISGYNLDLPVVLDWETDKGYRTYSGVSRQTLTNIIKVYCDTIEKYGYDSMIYMCKDDFINRINTTTITSNYKSWVAWYFSEYSGGRYFNYGDLMPDMTFDYNVWQYSCKGRVDGIPELTDMNVMILPKKTYPLQVNISKDTFVTNIGTSVDLRAGVSATDHEGNDATSLVSLKLLNTAGNTVAEKNYYNTPGKYYIEYRLVDADGNEAKKTATVYVRNKPVVYYGKSVWSESQTKTINYSFDNSVSEAENYNKIKELLNNNISAKYYDTIEQYGGEKNISGTFNGLEKVFANNEILPGTYMISYVAKDGKGLESTRNIKLVVEKIVIEETTTETESESESESETTTIIYETTS